MNTINHKLEKYLYEKLDITKEYAKKIEKEINAPVVETSISTLGGKDRSSIMISISLDPKNEWPNNIFQNSRYMQFSLDYEGILEQFTKSYKIEKKFRKARPKSIEDAIKKINNYISKIKT